ncbi:MHYT domain-containing protein [Actinomadura macra]|uniref:MHYT domain-containing protein n=1 Tax=Actinomadura macra TaxID=46164 RepID=UPI000829670C|nr:MHYT domain-containing protein [Actinomadura macra]
MTHVHHFTYGPLTPIAAYVMSFVGSLLGLQCTSRARVASGRSQASWLALAALSIGGTGVWVMHFIAMLGFSVSGLDIRYNIPLTLLSAVIAIVVVGIGMFLVGFGGEKARFVLPGGVITGLGVASMHYAGMAAMNMPADVSYQPGIVLLSIVIAVVAASAALWFTLHVRRTAATVGAALIMGVAVSGMHYTGMAAMRVQSLPGADPASGAQAGNLLMPLIVGVSIVAVALLVIVSVYPNENEVLYMAELERRVRDRRTGPPPPAQSPAIERKAGEWFGGGPPSAQ